jgi:hypothetical protein
MTHITACNLRISGAISYFIAFNATGIKFNDRQKFNLLLSEDRSITNVLGENAKPSEIL